MAGIPALLRPRRQSRTIGVTTKDKARNVLLYLVGKLGIPRDDEVLAETPVKSILQIRRVDRRIDGELRIVGLVIECAGDVVRQTRQCKVAQKRDGPTVTRRCGVQLLHDCVDDIWLDSGSNDLEPFRELLVCLDPGVVEKHAFVLCVH